jgi:hypothetical protein
MRLPARSHFAVYRPGNCERTPGIVVGVTARTIVGACALAALLGVGIYLLFQIPAVFAIGGIVVLVALVALLTRDAPAL